jgi:hypothetical protein
MILWAGILFETKITCFCADEHKELSKNMSW